MQDREVGVPPECIGHDIATTQISHVELTALPNTFVDTNIFLNMLSTMTVSEDRIFVPDSLENWLVDRSGQCKSAEAIERAKSPNAGMNMQNLVTTMQTPGKIFEARCVVSLVYL